jgi:hypothetical protein
MPVPVNTELAAGLQSGRGIDLVEPEDVAAAIVEALELPRHDVFVPKSVGRVIRMGGLLPRNVTEAMGRAMRTDRVLAQADPAARAAYEQRAAASEPKDETTPDKPADTPSQATPAAVGE